MADYSVGCIPQDCNKKEIPDYQKRVIYEHKELAAKTEKLLSFLESDSISNLNNNDVLLLKAQYDIMVSYLGILSIRISRFKND